MKGIVGGIATGFVIIVLIVCGFKCMERVPAGYVGVVYNMNGGIEQDVLRQGWKLVSLRLLLSIQLHLNSHI